MGTYRSMYSPCSKWTLKIKINPYGLTWENNMAPKYDLYEGPVQQFNAIQLLGAL